MTAWAGRGQARLADRSRSSGRSAQAVRRPIRQVSKARCSYPRTCSCAALSSFDLLGLSHAVNRKCPPSSPSVDQTKLERRWPACSWITSKACRAASERPSPDRPTLVGRQHLADLSQPSNKRNSYLRPAARCVNFCCEWEESSALQVPGEDRAWRSATPGSD